MIDNSLITILVIDDESAIRESYADCLEDLDYKVFIAENGRRGLDIFSQEKIDLILVDLQMPEVDGFEVLETVGKSSPNTPVIVISGAGDISNAVKAIHKGAWDYLLKPIMDFSILIHAVSKVLENSILKKENIKYQKHLEEMVSRKTEELNKANSDLLQINLRLRGIVDSTRHLSSCPNLEKFGSLLLQEFGQHMLATGGSLYLKEEKGMRLVHTLDPNHAAKLIPFPLLPDSIFQKVISDKKTFLIENIDSSEFVGSGWKGYGDGSALIFPLPDSTGEIIGVLTMHSKTLPPFVEQDKEIGSLLATYSCEALKSLQATETLRQNEQQFRAILDEIEIGIFIVEIESREIVYLNKTAAEMVGLTVKDVLGAKCFNLMCSHKEGHCPILDFGGEMRSVEVDLERNDKSKIPIMKTITPMNYHGKKVLLASIVDLTEQKRIGEKNENLEKQLRQAQKLESLGQLAGGIAHDFNNMLTGIMGATELLDRYASGNPKMKELLDIISTTSDRAANLTSKLLAFSRKGNVVEKIVNCHEIIDDAIDILEHSIDKVIKIDRDYQAKELFVMADASALQNAFINLGVNASHAMPKGGNLTFRSENITISQTESDKFSFEMKLGSYIKLTVSDSGSGMSLEVQERIFEPFFTTKEVGKGTGMGLAAVYGTVKNMDGAIVVESEMGVGTSFYLYFPLVDEGASKKALPKKGISNLVGATILVVEDDEIIRETSAELLDELGHSVILATDGQKGLDIYSKQKDEIDLILLDMVMPKMGGEDCFESIRKINPDAKVVLCSGFNRTDSLDRLISQGNCSFLKKPYHVDSLAEVINSLLTK